MYNNELYHHGIKGQRWGVRRFKNADGTLTKAGLKRYSNLSSTEKQKISKDKKNLIDAYRKQNAAKEALEFVNNIKNNSEEWKKHGWTDDDLSVLVSESTKEASSYKSRKRQESIIAEMNNNLSPIKKKLEASKYGSVEWFNTRDEYYKTMDSYGEKLAKAFIDDIGYKPSSAFSTKAFSEWIGVGEGYVNTHSDYRSIADPLTGDRDYDLVDPRTSKRS